MIRAWILGASLLAGAGVFSVSCGGTIDVPGRDSGPDGGACPGGCEDGLVCHDGECVDPEALCEGISCPAGQTCTLGQCIAIDDPCEGIVCPNPGEICQRGVCISGDADGDGDGVPARDDCDDSDAEIHPGATERCNGRDDDCDGAIDEAFDEDGDGFPGCSETPVGLRDCDDADAWIRPGASERCNAADDDCDGTVDEDNPGGGEACGESAGACEPGTTRCVDGELTCVGDIGPQPETCNGADDDCNGVPDDGDASASCPVPTHGVAACTTGVCHLAACDDGWDNINGVESDGCETEIDPYGDTCGAATDVGTVPDNGTSVEVVGTIAPAGDSDWVTFVAQDRADSSGCDTFHLEVSFLENPGDDYAFEVRRGGCGASAECGMSSVGTYEFTTDFRGAGDWGSEVRGECPCTASASAGANVCGDSTATYAIRVFRMDGAAATDYFRLRIRNG